MMGFACGEGGFRGWILTWLLKETETNKPTL